MSSIFGILYFLVAISIIVTVHEFGHLLTAKKFGVHCFEFSIGMGPKITKFYTDKSGTDYYLRAIPLGGYVMMAGENSGENVEDIPKDQLFNNKTPIQKIIILVAGAMMNFILGFLIYLSVGFFGGVQDLQSNMVTVQPNSAIAQAGIDTNDKIISINGQPTTTYEQIIAQLNENPIDFQNAQATINNQQHSLAQVNVEMSTVDESKYEIEYLPINSSESVRMSVQKVDGLLGIRPVEHKYNFLMSFKWAVAGFVDIISQVGQTLQILFSDGSQMKNLMGPVGLADMSKDVVQAGFSQSILMIAFLSINIGLVNLLPIPALDGGRIIFALLELILRRKLPDRIETTINAAGMLMLLGLFVFVLFNDTSRLFKSDEEILADARGLGDIVYVNASDDVSLTVPFDTELQTYKDASAIIKIENGNFATTDKSEIKVESLTEKMTIDFKAGDNTKLVINITDGEQISKQYILQFKETNETE